MANKQFSGITTALVTPFIKGNIDFLSLEKLIEYQLSRGVVGFVVNGTTGESPTLKWSEVKELVTFVRNKAPRSHLILGAGSNSTANVLEMVESSRLWPIDAIMSVVPYYNKPTQEGLYLHFSAIAAASKLPLILYNVPSRSVAALNIETILRLSKISNIIGIKEASGDLTFANKMRSELPKEFLLLSGDDFTCVDFINNGGDGVISVTSHLYSQDILKLLKSPNDNDTKNRFAKANELAFSISSPIPIKAMLYFANLISSPELRLPLVQLDEQKQNELKSKLRSAGLL
jgi:4-hydroxy-tetrahydrodipicolinate synthase